MESISRTSANGKASCDRIDWQRYDADIIGGLSDDNIIAYYRDRLGVKIAGQRPGNGGWLAVFAPGERHASAGICLGHGTARGRYKNHGGDGASYSIWEAGAKLGDFADWTDARTYLAVIAGVPPPRPPAAGASGKRGVLGGENDGKGAAAPGDEAGAEAAAPVKPGREPPDAKLRFLMPCITRDAAFAFAAAKPGVTVAAIMLAGGRAAHWPKTAPTPQMVLTFPAFRSPGGEPCRFLFVQAHGRLLRLYRGKGVPPDKSKVLCTRGGRPGLVNAYALKHLDEAEIVWKVEGLTDLLALHGAIPTKLLREHAVVTNSNGATETPDPACVKMLAGKVVYVVGDCDMAGRAGAERWCDALVGVAKEVRNVVLPYAVDQEGGKKDVRDYLNDGHTYADLLKLAAAASPRPDASGERECLGGENDGNGAAWAEPVIRETDAPTRAIAKAAKALGRNPFGLGIKSLYKRGGQLVRLLKGDDGVPRIRPLPKELLLEQLTAHACFPSEKGLPHPAKWLIDAIFVLGDWPDVPYLQAVVNYPVLRPDGAVQLKPGYDATTHTYLHWPGAPLELPESPTKADAARAADELLDLVAQFPFQSPAHRASWLGALLTPLARPAFEGCAPLFLADANVRGVGKTRLLNCAAVIVTGEPFTPEVFPKNEEELDKRLLTFARSGRQFVLFDNVCGGLGGGPLDMALTATSYGGRILGVTQDMAASLRATFYTTGNNVTLTGDTARRVCYVRLESDQEKPDQRGGFTHPDLLAYALAERPRLLTAALTILRAFVVAGRPQAGLKPWGGFERWSDLVRAAVFHAGLPDPMETCQQLQEESDVVAVAMTVLLECWQKMQGDFGDGLTTRAVIERLYREWHEYHPPEPDYYADMRAAVEDLGCRKSAYNLGCRLRDFRRRNFGGLAINHASAERGGKRKVMRWTVTAQP
jgi:hypothetical protein